MKWFCGITFTQKKLNLKVKKQTQVTRIVLYDCLLFSESHKITFETNEKAKKCSRIMKQNASTNSKICVPKTT